MTAASVPREAPEITLGAARIKGTFKRDQAELNGLTSIADQAGELTADGVPRRWPVAGLVERHKTEIGDTTRVVTFRFVGVEPATDEDAQLLREIMARAYAKRTGGKLAQPDLFDEDPDTEPDAAGDDKAKAAPSKRARAKVEAAAADADPPPAATFVDGTQPTEGATDTAERGELINA